MPADTRPDVPLHVSLRETLILAGRAALEGAVPLRSDEAFLNRLPLRPSGILQADGTGHPLGVSLYRNRRFAPRRVGPRPDPEDRIEGPAILGGVVSQHFGHVVTQSLGRLWAGELLPNAPILFLPETAGVTALPGYLADLARGLGVDNPLRLVARPTSVAELLVPQDVCNLSHRPTVTPFFLDWLARRRTQPVSAPSGRLYVSRSRLGPQHGQYLQEQVLEAALAASGYTIFHPQEHPVAVQVRAYMAAGELVFADGSPAHLWSLVAQPGQRAAVILRRPRDRQFARWFRSLDCARPDYLDNAVADFWRRGDGPGRSIALLDLQAVWDRLHILGYHDEPRPIGIDAARLADWVATLPPRRRGPLEPPFPLDPLSHKILALRRHAALRPRPEGS